MSQVSPGWYVDPAAPSAGVPPLRWWDGYTWTQHVAPAAPVSFAPVGPTTDDGVPLASWGWRVLAYLLDALIIAVPNAVATLPAQIDLQRETKALTRQLDASTASGGTPDVG